MFRNTFFNPADKRKTRRQILTEHCELHIIPKQKKLIHFYETKPNQYLIHDKNGNYKIVTKSYYFYEIQEEEYDTDTELINEEDLAEEQRIKNKYNNKTLNQRL
jgi:hypothetical protein